MPKKDESNVEQIKDVNQEMLLQALMMFCLFRARQWLDRHN